MTEFKLLKTPLYPDQPHTIYFTSLQQQESYFHGLTSRSFNDFTYQRKNGVVRLPLNFDEVVNYNYCMYRNPQRNKWYYAFILDTKYVDEGRTDITIDTDVLQTFMFNYDLAPCYVAREHCADDAIGKHTLPEGLETGEYIVNNIVPYHPLTRKFCTVVASTVDLTQDNFPHTAGSLHNGVYSGVDYFVFWDYTTLKSKIEAINSLGSVTTTTAIVAMFMCPAELLSGVTEIKTMGVTRLGSTSTVASKRWNVTNIPTDVYPEGTVDTIDKPTTINGYTPKNAKLFTYPYCYLLMDNNAGASAVYEYEKFYGSVDFSITFCVTPGGSLRIVPMRYNTGDKDYTLLDPLGGNNSEGLTGGKFPICSWTTDIYTNWLTQNSLNFEVRERQAQLNQQGAVVNGVIGMTTSLAPLVATLATAGAGGIGGAVASAGVGMTATSASTGVASSVWGMASANQQYELAIQSMNAEKYAHSLQPPTINGNLNSGDVTFARKSLTFTAYQMSIKEEYARIIDDHFSAYGYSCQRVKTPNENKRKSYWYLKTVNCNFKNYGSVSGEDIRKLRQIYDSGITFWTMHSVNQGKFRDYSIDNPIV